ncbi:unnamed protein product [Bursaphelenchus xylophilus]|uniref:General transcription factor IIF subunit 2 n=1 Tax=Bursaphelenchus xylophilus TaxID=6326 RepID=A0A1I7RT70_BURXY|nr:unnamed protein product [Bursaphelenchus xylophilus]CAG9122568.1 unnamed protein product [Bursaphelenchus xylophilus]
MSKPQKRAAPSEVVNCERAARGVWLVKVPRYLSEIWQKNQGKAVGSLITSQPVVFRSNPELETEQKKTPIVTNIVQSSSRALPDTLQPLGKKKENVEMPKEHRFLMKNLDNQTMAVLVEDKTGLEEDADQVSGRLTIDGRVVKRAECQPPATLDYMKMKIRQIEKISQPKHTVKQMDKAEVKFKPTSYHAEHMAKDRAKKDNVRSVRVDRDIVLKELFQAFEKHQYYRLVDLQRITQQPANYIKEILTTIANYNTTQPHKNMWELKSEYRDYGNKKEEEEDEDMDADGDDD